MRTRSFGRFSGVLALIAASALCGRTGVAQAAVTAAPGWAVRSIPTPDVVQGGVLRAGDAIYVGQGAFGVGTERVIRLDGEGGPATTLITGFNSLGGFDLDAAGTLYVADNGGNGPGAVTGDTLFALTNVLTRTTSVPALGLEVVPAGTIPFAQDVLVVPGAVLVSDAVGPGAGRVVSVAGGSATNLITGLGFAAGLALDGSSLLVGDVDGSFVGSIAEYTLAGAFVGPVVGGLGGNYTHVVADDGTVFVSGGFADDFSSTVLAFDGTNLSELARGFAFSSEMFWDTARQELLVLDFGVSEITALCRDGDGDGTCDVDEAGGCEQMVGVAEPVLKLAKLDTLPGDDKLTLKGVLTLPTTPSLDPVATGVHLRLEDVDGVLADVAVPPGAYTKATKIGWKANDAATAWKWKSPSGVLGITKVTIKTSPKKPGEVKLAVTGRNGSWPTTAAALPLSATLRLDEAGLCAGWSFLEPPPAPACSINGKQSTVTCKQ